MQFIDDGLLGLFVVVLFGVKGTWYDSQSLLFPVADLGGMNTVFSSQLIDCLVLFDGFNGNFAFKFSIVTFTNFCY